MSQGPLVRYRQTQTDVKMSAHFFFFPLWICDAEKSAHTHTCIDRYIDAHASTAWFPFAAICQLLKPQGRYGWLQPVPQLGAKMNSTADVWVAFLKVPKPIFPRRLPVSFHMRLLNVLLSWNNVIYLMMPQQNGWRSICVLFMIVFVKDDPCKLKKVNSRPLEDSPAGLSAQFISGLFILHPIKTLASRCLILHDKDPTVFQWKTPIIRSCPSDG